MKAGKRQEEVKAGALAGGRGETEVPMGEIRISVRGLVEFILRHGDIDNRHKASPDNAMQEGGRIHRMIQRRMGAEYQAEVPLRYTLEAGDYVLVVEGRADGIIHHEGVVTIDEIKGTYRELARMNAPARLHIAQAKCYAYIYARKEGLEAIQVRMTYCNLYTEELRYFYEGYTFQELEEWFLGVVGAYRKWADYAWKWHETRQASIQGLGFPFPYREGQRELVGNVYRTIYHKKKLFLEAPTGVGKTISTIFPAVQAMGKGMGEKLFYLTAKTITRTVAEDTLNLLREKGLKMKSVILTAKEKICFMEEAECHPGYCPYAQGHYDRVNDAVFDLITSQESFTREVIEEYALKHQVCPFEMCLDVSLYADAVICDYNYLFDPHVYLKRFFAEGTEGNYIFLVDEAHNLLERGREMYSAVLVKERFLELRRELKKTIVSETGKKRKKTVVSGQMTVDMTLNMTQDLTDASEKEDEGRKGCSGKSILVRQGYAEKMGAHLDKCNKELLALKREGGQCRVVENIEPFVQNLERLHTVMEDYLAEQEENKPEVVELLLDLYFEIRHFLLIYDLVDDNYVKYTQMGEDGSFLVKLFCVNPGENLNNCMHRGRSTILFSATFLPIQYYKKLLGGDEEDYEVYAQSVFNPEKRALLIAQDVTSKYSRRSEDEYVKIAYYIEEIVKNRHGNYMVFCPSHAFMKIIYERYVDNFGGKDRVCIIQGESMSEAEREAFLGHFLNVPNQGRGGTYGSGIFDEEAQGTAGIRSQGNLASQGQDTVGIQPQGNPVSQGQDMVGVQSQSNPISQGQDTVGIRSQGNPVTQERDTVGFPGQGYSDISSRAVEGGSVQSVSGFACGDSALSERGEVRETDIWSGDRILIGFCVLGGIFSEGIDLKRDSLIGAIIVGTGLPQVSAEKELLKGYFDSRGEDGFDYAFRYPGMNKVLQAAGRVIRTVEDVGIIALLDERFLQYSYRRLFPREWENFETVSVNGVAKRVERFWDEWL